MLWFLGIGVAVVLLALAEKKKSGLALPDILPSTGPGGVGETALQQEASSGAQTAAGVAGSLATGNIAGAATAAVSGLLNQLTQHSQRLGDAKAENTAIQPAAQAFDADLQTIGAAYTSGEISVSGAAAALAALDANLYSYLHGLVGKPGTAWNIPQQTMDQDQGATCNNACTVACCVYNNDFHSPLVAAYQYLLYYNGQGGNVTQVNPNARPWLNSSYGGNLVAGGFILGVPEIYPPDDPAYGSFKRPAYSVTFVPQKSLPLTALGAVI
jgi:hypothetical protein